MGIVYHHRPAVLGEIAADDPVVAADVVDRAFGQFALFFENHLGELMERVVVGPVPGKRDVFGLEADRIPIGVVQAENVVFQQGIAIDQRVQRQVRLMGVEILQFLYLIFPYQAYRAADSQFRADIAEQALVARNHHFLGPMPGLDSEQMERERQCVGVFESFVDIGVHAMHE